eukprot:9485000-Pyramimonas_sp.AAC.2
MAWPPLQVDEGASRLDKRSLAHTNYTPDGSQCSGRRAIVSDPCCSPALRSAIQRCLVTVAPCPVTIKVTYRVCDKP